jgi:GxxExxY protein
VERHKSERSVNEITDIIIGAAIEVHRELGPGLLESVYEICLVHELKERGLQVVRQKEVPVIYKNVELDARLKIDVLVEDIVVVELKATQRIEPINEAQLLTYLKLSGHTIGLIVNFNEVALRHGIRRMVNRFEG